MGIFGLGSSKNAKSGKKAAAKKTAAKGKTGASKNKEAQAVLAKMKAKKDAGDCAFC